MPEAGRLLILIAVLLLRPAILSAQSVAQVFERVREAVVVVHTSHTEFPLLSREMPVSVGGGGSGVLVSPTEVLTAAHVVQAVDEIIVEFPSGEQIGATVVASRPTHDVALLRLGRPASVVPLPLGDSDEVSVGDRVFVVGAPLGESHTLTVGYVSARRNVRGFFPGASSVEFLQTAGVKGPIFHPPGPGSYLLAHDFPVFIDPRGEVYMDRIIGEFEDLRHHPGKLPEYVDKYDFRVILLQLLIISRVKVALGFLELGLFCEKKFCGITSFFGF